MTRMGRAADERVARPRAPPFPAVLRAAAGLVVVGCVQRRS